MSKVKYIYKIATQAQWDNAVAAGSFKGAPVDLADGYIHFSTADQMRETAQKHFRGQTNLLLVEVEVAALGKALKWEVSRGGALFPHLYAELDTGITTRVMPLKDLADGGHEFPDDL